MRWRRWLLAAALSVQGCLTGPDDTLEEGNLTLVFARNEVTVGDTVSVTVVLRRVTGGLAGEGKTIELEVTAGEFVSTKLPVARGRTAELGTMVTVLRAPAVAGEITVRARSGEIRAEGRVTVRTPPPDEPDQATRAEG